jgi:hypothetical protein
VVTTLVYGATSLEGTGQIASPSCMLRFFPAPAAPSRQDGFEGVDRQPLRELRGHHVPHPTIDVSFAAIPAAASIVATPFHLVRGGGFALGQLASSPEVAFLSRCGIEFRVFALRRHLPCEPGGVIANTNNDSICSLLADARCGVGVLLIRICASQLTVFRTCVICRTRPIDRNLASLRVVE